MAISLAVLSTRAGVMAYPNEAAEVLAEDPPNSTHPVITDEVLATRAGCLRFPNEAAGYIAELDTSSSSSSSSTSTSGIVPLGIGSMAIGSTFIIG